MVARFQRASKGLGAAGLPGVALQAALEGRRERLDTLAGHRLGDADLLRDLADRLAVVGAEDRFEQVHHTLLCGAPIMIAAAGSA